MRTETLFSCWDKYERSPLLKGGRNKKTLKKVLCTLQAARAVEFSSRVSKMLCRSHDDQRSGSFLKQRISMALQMGNAACVLGTMSDRDAFEEIYYIYIFLQKKLCYWVRDISSPAIWATIWRRDCMKWVE